MFAAHLSEISIDRKDPGQLFDADKASRQLARKFADLAAKIVQSSSLAAPPTPKARRSSEKKIRTLIETEERFKSVQGFMKDWNKWRAFYFDLGEVQPKSRGQLTSIENAVEFCTTGEYNLTMMIACIHKAYTRRTMRPAFNAIVAYGADLYEKFYDEVLADLDRADYEERAMR